MKDNFEQIIRRQKQGYTATLYGTADLANFQRIEDIEELEKIVKKLFISIVSNSLPSKTFEVDFNGNVKAGLIIKDKLWKI